MRANSKLFWAFTGGLLIVSCLFKGWLTNQNTLSFLSDIALARAALDPLLNAEQSPRILIAGGSNALSGYDSTVITQTTGIPTFNLSLPGEGNNYLNVFQIVESRARSNDIVLLSTIRLVSALPPDQSANLSLRIIGNDSWQIPHVAKSLSLPTGKYLLPVESMFADQTLIRTLLTWLHPYYIELAKNGSEQTENFYERKSAMNSSEKNTRKNIFDQRGDWINCTTPKNPSPIAYDPRMVEQSEKYLAALDQFADRLQARGVTLRVTPATILVKRSDMQQWREQYLTISRALHTAVILPIDLSRQLLTDPALFCDSNAHLLRSQIASNNRAVVETVKNLTGNQAIIEPVKHMNADGAV